MRSQKTAALLFRCLCLILILLAFDLAAMSQTADLSGIVKDSSQAAVTGASINIIKESTGLKHSTTSSDQGLYRFPFLLPGTYTITVQAAGFRVVSRPGVKLDPGQEARLDFTLLPATLEQSITVRGTRSSLQTESSAIGTEVDPQLVQELPLNGRTFQSLIALAPGVVMPATLNQSHPDPGGIIVNGQRSSANYFTVDGVSANVGMEDSAVFVGAAAGGAVPGYTVLGTTHNLVSLDDMQEFKLQTSTYPAAFGRAAGGQLQIVTRSGSNEFHGSVFDYFRNEALDANDWFANSGGLPRAAHRENDFGGTFGGPILKNRTFFFFSYEGLRLRLPSSSKIQVPSLSARQAATGAIQQLLDAYPLPNGPEDPATMLALVTSSNANLLSSDNTSVRMDHVINTKLMLFGRYSEAPSEDNRTSLSQLELHQRNFHSLTLGATFALSTKTTSDLRVNYSRNEAAASVALTSSGGAVPPPDSLMFPAPFASPRSSLFAVNGLCGTTRRAGRGADNLQRQGNFVSNTSILQGSHEVRFGVDYRYLAPHYGPFDYRQNVFFPGVPAALSGVARRATIKTLDSVTLGFHDVSLYGQDSWKVAPRFTLIYGLRWELNPPPHAKGNEQLLTLAGFPDLASIQLAPPGTPVYDTTYANFAPRLGAAYQVSQHPGRETTLRGGFGVFYDLGVGNIGDAALAFPHLRVKTTFRVPYPLSAEDAAPPPPTSLDPPYSGRFNVFAPHHELPRSYQWNITIDQRIDSNQIISASYIGEIGRRLLRENFLTDPNTRFSDSAIAITSNASSSDYHALQMQFQRQMSRGLSALLSYTWSHSTDDTSTDEGFDNVTDPHLDRGPSDFDVRHAFTAALTYDIPGPNRNRVLRAILSRWFVASIFSARTALPINVFVERGDVDIIANPDLLNVRPDHIPGVALYVPDPASPGGRRINSEAFSVPIEIRQGNLGRNALRGFSFNQLDFAIRRQFSITEKMKLHWRIDLFNIFNHPNFGVVDSDLGLFSPPLQPNPTFGVAVGTLGGARSIQLSLRLLF